MAPSARLLCCLVSLLAFLSLITHARAAAQDITGTDASGVTRQLAVNRYPALYTGAFGDCLGGQSLFNITKYDAACEWDRHIVFTCEGRCL
jgi:hypothetical protein